MEAKAIVLKSSSHNVLGLDDPSSYSCHVARYHKGHSILLIEVQKIGEDEWKPWYLGFEAVFYFDGRIGWKGADLCVASQDELIAFATYKAIPPASSTLCVFESPDSPVKLLTGSSVTILDAIPDYMRFRTEGK
jgi:hypothetical protein